MTAILLGLAFATAWGEGYNLAGLSYGLDHYGYNKEWGKDASDDNFLLHGVGVHYLHGFGLGKNMFLETGVAFNSAFGTRKSDTNVYSPGEQGTISITGKRETTYRSLSFNVPVSYVIEIPLSEKVSFNPFAGIDFRFNCMMKGKECFDETATLTIPGEPVQVFNTSSKGSYSNMLKDDWNVFQLGWHVGIGFDVWKLNLRASYGTYFIPAYSRDEEGKYLSSSSRSGGGDKEHLRVNQGEFRFAVSWKF